MKLPDLTKTQFLDEGGSLKQYRRRSGLVLISPEGVLHKPNREPVAETRKWYKDQGWQIKTCWYLVPVE